MGHWRIPLLLAVFCATFCTTFCTVFCTMPAAAGEPVSDPAGGEDCALLTGAAYGTVPLLFHEGRADSLLVLLDRWEGVCEPDEVIRRTLILGAIWDGAFTEDLYDQQIMDDLVQRGAEFRDEPPATPARAAYDSFTVELADQLLPHQPPGSPEEFFCLFYSGRTDEAWALIEDGELAYSDLAYYRARRLVLLEETGSSLQVAFTAGSWYPVEDLNFVGEKPLLGLLVGWWEDLWFGRLVAEWRPGRTDQPYWTERDGKVYLSDRWDALLLGGEVGRRILGQDRWRLDVFAGVGVDMVKPLGGSRDLLAAVHVSIGSGLRYELDQDRHWYVGADLRSESISERNAEAVNLGGEAWSARFVLGRRLTGYDRRTAGLLGR